MGEISVLGWFPSGEVMFSGATDTQVKIWNLMDGTCVQTLAGVHKRGITQIIPIEKGRNLLTCGSDGLCVLWECGSGRAVHVTPVRIRRTLRSSTPNLNLTQSQKVTNP